MSERGYDSDAHFITTPRRGELLGRPPGNRPFRRMELSDLIEQSQERSEAERWALANNQNASPSQESAFGMHFIPTPPSSLRGPPTAFHTARETDESRVQQASSLRGEQPLTDPITNTNFLRSLPSLSSIHPAPSASHSEHSPVIQISDNNSGRDLMTDWKQFLKASRDRYALGSSGSLAGPSTNLVVPKTRLPSNSARSFTDPRSVHLSEMGISNRLASHSQSSQVVSCSPSMAELVRKNRPGGLIANSSQENMQLHQKSSTSALSGNETPHNHVVGPRDTSSCYSRASPSSGNVSLGGQSLRKLTQKVLNKSPEPQKTVSSPQRRISSEGEATSVPAPRHTLLSRFQEHCDSESSGPPQFPNVATGLVTPRKISVGWMSGGRRIGFGYSPVAEKDAESPKKYDQTFSQLSQVSGVNAEFTKTNEPSGVSPSHVRLEQVRRSSARQYTTPAPDYSKGSGNEPSTVPRSIKSVKSNAGYSAFPHIRAMLNRSSHEQGPSTGVLEEDIRDLCAPELTATVQTEYCQVPQTSHYTSQARNSESLSRQWARLNRTKDTSRPQITGPNAVYRQQAPQDGAFSMDRLEDPGQEYPAYNYREYQDQTPGLQSNPSRTSRWARKFSKYRESRKPSHVRQQELSQGSSGPYQDCDSTNASLKGAASTKSNATDDVDCLEMPGSFEGSRWASRISRML